MENKESKSLGGILGEQLDVIKEIRKEQINITDKNDENYKAVLNLLEREKEEKSKSENLLEENRKTLVVASNIIKDFYNLIIFFCIM